ncbi:21129_t:CDS:1, partial [Gigaspora rosea]
KGAFGKEPSATMEYKWLSLFTKFRKRRATFTSPRQRGPFNTKNENAIIF